MKDNTMVHVIEGDHDSGKTLTAWLVYLSLKAIGSVEYFHVFHGGIYDPIAPSEQPAQDILSYTNSNGKIVIYDFCAIVVVKNIRIAIFSPGDFACTIGVVFMWIMIVKVDLLIMCCRHRGKSNARKALNTYKNQYPMSFHRIYRGQGLSDFEQIRANKMLLAKEIVDQITK